MSALGWDASFAALFTEHAAAGLVPARVARVDRGRCDVLTAAGPVRAASRGPAHSDPAHAVCTGDWAALRPGPEPDLVALLPRRSAITRAGADRTSRGQVLAANVDTVVVAVCLADALKAGRIERLLTLARDSGARPVIALTKLDLADDSAAAHAEIGALAPGVDTVATSSATGEGLDVLTATLTGTTVLLGPSGAGKSTLANALLGQDRMDTGAVRAADGKGRHTTVHRELLVLPGGGVLIDTPGLRGIGLQGAADGVEQVFAEIHERAQGCAFRDCTHASEPGCAVQEAIAEGQLSERRLAGYRKLQRESAWAAARETARPTGKRSEFRKAITRHQRATRRFFDQQQ
ncbi:ribosome small subunit-dependent GTPase A [Streptomyces spectabilis]|uniref:Small ribosomal subunit biogenesis GTPase RsgA n=1 Tax=Streptomyces spectabilis TaxID=68270 RepID=A0A516RKC6_STRST|nr:ribosome small subunit-dependent GTPase A [Streptomyces spectabilis]